MGGRDYLLEPGTEIGGAFRIIRPLGKGGMGQVYLAEHMNTLRRRALKIVLPDQKTNTVDVERFNREARATHGLATPHIAEIIDANVDPHLDLRWIAMEFVDGQTLFDRVQEKGPLPFDLARQLAAQLRNGLGEAHAAGLVHRDLKPENMMLGRPRYPELPFELKILDFGLVKVIEDTRPRASSIFGGTPLWMAPEQLEMGEISPATDVWALGLIIYWSLTHLLYWRESKGTLPQLLEEVMYGPLHPPSQRAEEEGVRGVLPAGFDDWFARCVRRRPVERLPSAAEAMLALERLLQAHPVPPIPAPPGPDPLGKTEAGAATIKLIREGSPPFQRDYAADVEIGRGELYGVAPRDVVKAMPRSSFWIRFRNGTAYLEATSDVLPVSLNGRALPLGELVEVPRGPVPLQLGAITLRIAREYPPVTV
jgi:serine/threonine protein kinase